MTGEAGKIIPAPSVMDPEGVRELYAIEGGALGTLAARYGGTAPVAGTGWIIAVHLEVGQLAAVPLPGAVAFALFWNDFVPASDAELKRGEAVFRHLVGPTNASGLLSASSDGGGELITGPFAAEPRGRMLTMRAYNAGPATLSVAVFLLFERCAATPADGTKGLGACWA